MSKLQDSINKMTVTQLAESLRFMVNVPEVNLLHRAAEVLEGKQKTLSKTDLNTFRTLADEYKDEPVWEGRYLVLRRIAGILGMVAGGRE